MSAPIQHEAGSLHAERGANVATASVNDGKTAVVALWLAVGAALFAVAGFTLAVTAAISTSSMYTAGLSLAEQAGRAAAKAETATARANVAEIYAKQLFTEMNRLGYPIRTPAEAHDPQPPEVAIPENTQ